MPHFAALAISPHAKRIVFADARAKDTALAQMLGQFPNAIAFIGPSGSLIVDGWV